MKTIPITMKLRIKKISEIADGQKFMAVKGQVSYFIEFFLVRLDYQHVNFSFE